NTYETYQAILKGNVPPPSRYNADVDAELDQVVLKALAYHKEDRHDTAEALGEALLAWLHRRGTSVSASDVARYLERVCGPAIARARRSRCRSAPRRSAPRRWPPPTSTIRATPWSRATRPSGCAPSRRTKTSGCPVRAARPARATRRPAAAPATSRPPRCGRP